MGTRQLHTVEEVISELGGYKAVAKLTGRPAISTTPNWVLRQCFPTNTYAIMQSALEDKGLSAPGSLWKMPEVVREREGASS